MKSIIPRSSLIIVLCFIAGIVSGIYALLPDTFLDNDFSLYALYGLMFFVGVSIGADTTSWQMLKQTKLNILLIPLSVVVGTLLGVVVFSFFFTDIDTRESLAVGFGFGYYSLSSILITEISGKSLGIIALLCNILREIITLLLAPVFSKYFGKLAPIASGGATSMDTTLGVITQFSGKEYAILSVFSGTVLTILVPFLVTFVLKI